ncbi:MAG: DUF308 domain-containing protein [Faecalibacterium sp.]|jgi:uncharacterized membrane protein HdeD (DUF308 family)|nr:DUF308 domain-containing protein [Faecalibacterium sp.]
MDMQKRQKLNIFLSAVISATTYGMLLQGYAPSSELFLRLLGGMIATAGGVLLWEDLSAKEANFGSSDIILGTAKLLLGGWILLYPASAAPYLSVLVAGMLFFHSLSLLQLAAETRHLHKGKAIRMAVAGGITAAAGILVVVLRNTAYRETLLSIGLLVDTAALFVTGFLLLFVRKKAAEPSKAEKQPTGKVKSQAAAAAAIGENAPVAGAALTADAQPALPQADAEEDAPVPLTPEQIAQDKEDEAAAQDMLKGLGRMASRVGKRASDTAKATVRGFQDGMQEGKQGHVTK